MIEAWYVACVTPSCAQLNHGEGEGGKLKFIVLINGFDVRDVEV